MNRIVRVVVVVVLLLLLLGGFYQLSKFVLEVPFNRCVLVMFLELMFNRCVRMLPIYHLAGVHTPIKSISEEQFKPILQYNAMLNKHS